MLACLIKFASRFSIYIVVFTLSSLVCSNLSFAATSVLSYSTYIGGNDQEQITGMHADLQGNVYIAGITYSSNFPVTPGAFMTTSKAGQNCGTSPNFFPCAVGFVSKLNASGTQLTYSTFFPEPISGMAIDANGNAYVMGVVLDSDYQTTAGALANPNAKLFIAKLNASGSSLDYAAQFGSSGNDFPSAIAADGMGNAYLVGWSYASDYPVTPGAFETAQTGAFVTKLNAAGSALVYSARLGGSDTLFNAGLGTRPEAISVDSSGEAYIAGVSDSATFPVTSTAYQGKLAGGADAFVSRMNAGGSALIYASFLGGGSGGYSAGCCSFEGAYALAADGKGGAFVTGAMRNSSILFPVTSGVFQRAFVPNSESDTFVARFNTNASGAASLIYSTLLGGRTFSQSINRGISVDTNGNALVTGPTTDLVFPTTPTAIQSCRSGGNDVFIALVGPIGNQLLFSTLIGGTAEDSPVAAALDGSGNAYVAGTTASSNFPVTSGVLQSTNGGKFNGFVAKFNRAAFTTPAANVVICSPGAGASLSRTFQVAGGLQSGRRAQWMAVYIDGVKKYQQNNLNMLEPSITTSAGKHQLTVKAKTASGTIVSKSIAITTH